MRLIRGAVQSREAKKEIRMVVEKVKVKGGSFFRKEKSQIFGKENRSGYSDFFGKKKLDILNSRKE